MNNGKSVEKMKKSKMFKNFRIAAAVIFAAIYAGGVVRGFAKGGRAVSCSVRPFGHEPVLRIFRRRAFDDGSDCVADVRVRQVLLRLFLPDGDMAGLCFLCLQDET